MRESKPPTDTFRHKLQLSDSVYVGICYKVVVHLCDSMPPFGHQLLARRPLGSPEIKPWPTPRWPVLFVIKAAMLKQKLLTFTSVCCLAWKLMKHSAVFVIVEEGNWCVLWPDFGTTAPHSLRRGCALLHSMMSLCLTE